MCGSIADTAAFSMSQVIVIGGGLSGLSAAHTVLERGGNVVSTPVPSPLTSSSSSTRTSSWAYVELPFATNKQGNSTKATSGINGAGTKAQQVCQRVDSPNPRT